ncbi:MAG: PAS domain-containing sensor histidine kinase [Halopseudomonas aestusnigri]
MNKNNSASLSFPSQIVSGAILLSLMMISWMGWVIFDVSRFTEQTKTIFLPLERLHGEILQYDEILTMSARMAALTGEKSWIERYLQYEPLLDGAIKKVIDLSHSSDMIVAVKETETANIKLVEMEHRSFELLNAGNAKEANALLSGEDYRQQKVMYAKGMANLLNLLTQNIDSRILDQRYKDTLSIAGVLILLFMTFLTWIAVYRSIARWRAALTHNITKREEAEAALSKSHSELDQKVRERTSDINAEINERKGIEVALKKSESRFKDFAASASDWLWEMDKDLRFIYFSERNKEITGFEPTLYIGKSRREVAVGKTKNENWQRHFEDLDNHRQFRDFRYNLTRADNTKLTVSISGKPVYDEAGNFAGYRGSGSDITIQRLAEDARDDAFREAELANKTKSEFLATMSHEFRTPLNAILGFSDVMRLQFFGPLGSDTYKEYANDIHVSGEHMLALVNDVLDIAAIEAGKRPFSKEPCALDDLIKSAVRNVEHTAEKRGLSLSSDIPADLPILYADVRSMRQIFLNLLSNAVKFTNSHGEIKISALATEQELFVTIIDTGIGIPADKLPDITKPFSQLHTNPHTTQIGTGLGLSIVVSLVEAHDGAMDIKSEVGVGTTVTVAFPLN